MLTLESATPRLELSVRSPHDAEHAPHGIAQRCLKATKALAPRVLTPSPPDQSRMTWHGARPHPRPPRRQREYRPSQGALGKCCA